MLGAALIVLREVLEASLIIGIALAAARGVAHSRRYIAAGVAVGVIGSLLVAAGAEALAAAAEGMGQELFNAAVLLLAVVMLGWHNVWMRRHGTELSSNLRALGQAVASGARPLSMLLIVVALAVLREGAEVVLFLHGIAAGGTGATALAGGALLGLAGGAAAGAVLYFGLLQVPLRHLFLVTAALVLLLAAGMSSQAAGLLVQAGWLPAIVEPVWDASSILSERGIGGQILHALIGYQERPAAMQLVFFVVTFVTILGLMRLAGSRSSPVRTAVPAAALLALVVVGVCASPQPARADHLVYSPIVEPGEVAVELRGHRDFDQRDAADGAQTWTAEFEWAPLERWRTEAFVEYEKNPGGSLTATEVAWENVFQLTEQGRYWADFGLVAEYAHALEDDGEDKFELGLLAEKSAGRHVTTANLKFERELVGDAATEAGYALQYRYRLSEALEPGVELYGEFGEVGDYGALTDHEHQLGPGLFGKLRTPAGAFRYQAVLLFGLTSASPDTTLRLLLEYEF